MCVSAAARSEVSEQTCLSGWSQAGSISSAKVAVIPEDDQASQDHSWVTWCARYRLARTYATLKDERSAHLARQQFDDVPFTRSRDIGRFRARFRQARTRCNDSVPRFLESSPTTSLSREHRGHRQRVIRSGEPPECPVELNTFFSVAAASRDSGTHESAETWSGQAETARDIRMRVIVPEDDDGFRPQLYPSVAHPFR